MKKELINNIEEYFLNFGYEEGDRAFLSGEAKKLLDVPENGEVLSDFAKRYIGGELDFKAFLDAAKDAGARASVHEYTAVLIFCAAIAPYALPYFVKAGLGKAEWYDSMSDLKWKLGECKKVYGIVGVFAGEWFGRFYTAARVAFGRLQFNMYASPCDYKSDRFDINEGDPVVSIHIPSDTRTPFSVEERERAYTRAREFYKKEFGNGRVIFHCGSWLINPKFNELLPESSNIRSFTNEFEIYEVKEGGANNIWRLFYTKDYNGDPSTLPEDTSLMRIYKAHLLAGGTMDVGRGFKY